MLPSGQKLTLGLLATIILEVSSLLRVCTFSSASPIFFKCVLEVLCCGDVQHRLRFCIDRPNCVSGGLSHLSSISETDKSRVRGGRQSCCIWPKVASWKNCETMRCRGETASPFFFNILGEVFGHFHAVAVKRHNSIARVFRRDSHPTRSRRSTGSGGESSSMLTSAEGNAVQAFSMLL
jgi:hypothetical protein